MPLNRPADDHRNKADRAGRIRQALFDALATHDRTKALTRATVHMPGNRAIIRLSVMSSRHKPARLSFLSFAIPLNKRLTRIPPMSATIPVSMKPTEKRPRFGSDTRAKSANIVDITVRTRTMTSRRFSAASTAALGGAPAPFWPCPSQHCRYVGAPRQLAPRIPVRPAIP